MEKNMGMADRIVRVIIAAIVIALFMTKIISGALAIILMIFASVFLLTSFVGFCPLYRMVGLGSLRKKKDA